MKIDNFDVLVRMQCYEGAWVHLQSMQNVNFCEYCNAYKLLLKTICNIRSANSAMNLYIDNANFDG